MLSCQRCGYTTDKRMNMEKHILQRKTLCPARCKDIQRSELVFMFNKRLKELDNNMDTAQKEFVCYFCNKSFSSRSGRAEHIRKCHTEEYDEIIKTVTTSISGDSNMTIVGDNNVLTTNNNVTNYHIHLNPFGQENTEFLTDEERRKCLSAGFPGLQKILNDIYFNKEHPENHNVKLKSLKHEIVLVYTVEEDWEHRHIDDAVDRMVQTSQSEIQKVHMVPEQEQLQKMSDIYNPTPSQRSNTKKKVTAKLVDRKEKAKP